MNLTTTAADAAAEAARAAAARNAQALQRSLLNDRTALINLVREKLGIVIGEAQLVPKATPFIGYGQHAFIVDGVALGVKVDRRHEADDDPNLELTLVHADGTFSSITTNPTGHYSDGSSGPVTSMADLGRRMNAKLIKAHVLVERGGYKYLDYIPGVGFAEGADPQQPLGNPVVDQVRLLLDSIGPGVAEAVALLVVADEEHPELAPLLPVAKQIIAEA